MKRAALVVCALAAGPACKKKDAAPEGTPITAPWTDDFERDELGSDWHSESSAFQLTNGALQAQGAHNQPLWLRKQLPRDAVIEVTAWSQSPAGDLKVEIYGDGKSFDPDRGAYMATGYVLVMGGWNNSKSIIARRDEHGVVGKDLVERMAPRVEVGKRYRWRIVRKGGRIDWFVDDMTTPFLTFDDPEPLAGPGNAYFAVGNWEADNWFDDLSIRPADGAAP